MFIRRFAEQDRPVGPFVRSGHDRLKKNCALVMKQLADHRQAQTAYWEERRQAPAFLTMNTRSEDGLMRLHRHTTGALADGEVRYLLASAPGHLADLRSGDAAVAGTHMTALLEMTKDVQAIGALPSWGVPLLPVRTTGAGEDRGVEDDDRCDKALHFLRPEGLR
ncbi:hypothetical protein [Deinococcus sp. UYEF24]